MNVAWYLLPDANRNCAEHDHQPRGHQQHGDGEDADVEQGLDRASSVVVPFRVGTVEQELQRRRCVELQLGVRLVGNVGVVGDQERRPGTRIRRTACSECSGRPRQFGPPEAFTIGRLSG